jgi:ribosomal protein L37AE/L43A
VLVIAGFFAFFQRYQENLTHDQMTILTILTVGLATGAAIRSSFYKWSGWTLFLVLLLILPVGMLALGFFTNWQIGLGPLEPWLNGKVDIEQILHLGGGLIVSVITLAAWRKPRTKVQPEAPVSYQELDRREAERTPSSVRPVKHVRFLRGNSSKPAKIGRGTSWFPKFNGFPKFHWGKSKTVDKKLVVSVDRKPARLGFKGMFKRKPNVNLALVENHRCPYCLEEVKLSDPRGVKRCEVCGAVHHADCWDVTGECQVPHLNT